MSYKSRAQKGLFRYLESKGKMPKREDREDHESMDYHELPEHMMKKAFGGRIDAEEDYEMDNDLSSSHHSAHGMAEPRDEEEMPWMSEGDDMPEHYAHGGMVGNEKENYDYEMGHVSEYDSAGEPHTEGKMEDEQPMEYMSKGGRAKKMSKGGMMNRSGFIKSLRRSG